MDTYSSPPYLGEGKGCHERHSGHWMSSLGRKYWGTSELWHYRACSVLGTIAIHGCDNAPKCSFLGVRYYDTRLHMNCAGNSIALKHLPSGLTRQRNSLGQNELLLNRFRRCCYQLLSETSAREDACSPQNSSRPQCRHPGHLQVHLEEEVDKTKGKAPMPQ